MNRIYISDHGDDKNDGRTRETAIYSWKRAIELCDSNAEANLMQGDATLQRLTEEIERRKKETKKSADRSRRPLAAPSCATTKLNAVGGGGAGSIPWTGTINPPPCMGS
jgi:hypothetical protein